MKIIMALLFLVAVITITVAYPASAQTNTPLGSKEKTIEATSVNSSSRKEYILPYPGILPDHPLFVLKTFRDYLLDKLIVDPVRKSEFYILQADKRLQMGIFLSAKGKGSLAQESFSLAVIYLDKAVHSLTKIKAGGKEVPVYIADRLEQSLTKNDEELTNLVLRATGSEKDALVKNLEQVQKLQGILGN